MKNNKLFNKAVEKLQKSGAKASESLNEVAQACQGLRSLNIDIDELSRSSPVTSALQEKVTKEMIEDAVKRVDAQTTVHKETIEPAEEWIWVTGYKGTDKDMKCRDYQFMLNYRHEMAAGAEISICSSGFHFCPKLKDVFDYYGIKKGNRFFEVRALVRKKDYEERNGIIRPVYSGPYPWGMYPTFVDKLTSKAIEFVRELTLDEIFAGTDAAGWSDDAKKLALEVGIEEARLANNVADLVSLGYSEQLSNYIVRELKKYNLAKFLCALPENPSMDTKMLILFSDACDVKPDVLKKTFDLAMGNF